MCWSSGIPEVRKAIMSLSWKLLPFAALAVLGAFLVGGAFNSAPKAEAALDSIDSSANLSEGENTVTITIVGEDDIGELTISVSGGEDPEISDVTCASCVDSDFIQDDDTEWVIQTDTIDGDGTADDLTITFTLTVECEEDDEVLITVTEEGEDGDSIDEALECGAPITPTVGAAATVVAQASPSTVNCNGTSIVTIQVRTAGGQPVAVGTNVTIQASIGSVSPSSGQTTSADGSVFVFYTAPSNAGGAATITARAGNAQGTATVTVNCAAPAPTTAPPPPTVSPGVITPPSTGDAGIGSDRTDWTPFAGIAVIVATLIGGAVAAVKTRE
jgi:hypothetical protein